MNIKISRFFLNLGEMIKVKTMNFVHNKNGVRTAFLYSLLGIIPGLGQIFNKQWYKSIPLWIFLLLVITIEFSTARYSFAAEELANPMYGESVYQVSYSFFNVGEVDQTIYFWRDYGGFFTKGLWGLFTLGKVSDSLFSLKTYRGFFISVEIQENLPWTRFDDSAYLLGFGIIASILLMVVLVTWIAMIVDTYKTRKNLINGKETPTFVQFIKETYERLFVYIILIPAIILILIFTLAPLLFSAFVAFTNYTRSVKLARWTGWDAFATIVNDASLLQYFLNTLLWTILWALMSSFTVYVVGFIHALVIESKAVSGIYLKIGKRRISFFGKKFWRTIFILPWAIPSMITLMAFKNVFEVTGPANELIRLLGLGDELVNVFRTLGLMGDAGFPISWFSNPQNGNLAKFVIVLVNLWLGWPYHMMLITGVLATIPSELYEAADIDGASGWQKFTNITLPQVLISTMPSIIMTFSFNFNNFGAIYFLTGGGPSYPSSAVGAPGQTDILISWIYKLTFNGDTGFYNRGAVYSILIFLLVGIFSVWNMSRTKLMQEEE